MDAQVEHEICGNCKKEIPQPNYVMHTAHCARNITLCQICKEPIPKNQFDEHKKSCIKPVKTKKTVVEPPLPPLKLENSHYYEERKTIEDRKIAARKERELKKYERLVDTGYMLKETNKTTKKNGVKTTDDTTTNQKIKEYQMNGDNRGGGGGGSGSDSSGAKPKSNIVKKLPQIKTPPPATTTTAPSRSVGLLACKFCDLELPKLELDDHENYCGSRTDKCLECGELVMFKYKQIHMDSNHGFLKLKDEPGPRPSWESTTNRETTSTTTARPRATPFIPFTTVDATLYSFPSTLRTSSSASELKKDKGESYKEITRRLDCKTEYIRNLLHDSASITVPLRHNGAVPRNHFNHNKGPAPQPPRRRPNPPTELLIPCEFCQTPIPHEDLIQHETGCRPDLARYNPRRRSSLEADDYFVAPPPPPPSQQQEPSSPEVELPCEFCADMIPASQLLRHQAACI